MKNILPKKMFVFYIMLALTFSFFIPIDVLASNESEFEIIEIDVKQEGEIIEITYEINDYTEKTINIHDTEYKIITIGKESNLLLKGQPDLPNICRSIIIPDNTKMKIDITNTQYQEIKNTQIAPSKGNLLRNTNPETIPYEFSETYQKDTYYPEKIATLREPYILRDYRAQVIEIYPIQYNPIQKTIRIYNQIQIKITPDGTDDKNTIQRDSLPEKIDTNYKQIYQRKFINYGMQGRYDPVEEQGNMLIITYDDFRTDMQSYVDWKILRGIPTEIVMVSTIGSANDIKSFISDYYFENGLTFVLLVGDAQQIPTLNAGGSGSDPSYTYIVGDDHYPDLFIGRFSAQNGEQLQTMIERSMEYERNPQIGAEWYHKGTGVASSQGAGIGDEGEADWEHMRNIRTKIMDYTYTVVDEFYDGSQGGEDASGNPNPSMVAEGLNDGRSIVNYCGHGSPYSWGSSGFGISDIHNLENDNMLPFVTCVACNNGQFDDYDECFCEAWLRATNDETGEPTGALVSTGSTKSMSWAPPMDAQDEFIDLIVETYEDNVKHTIGGIHYNGVMHMNDEYGSAGISETDTWHFFGDPSILLRTDTPSEMSVEHSQYLDLKTLSLEVTVNDIEGALCSIYRDNIVYGSAYTDETGYALIELDESFTGTEPVELLITAYNKVPYIAEIIVNTEPAIPNLPEGAETGVPHKEYIYETSTIDDEGDQVYYQWCWGDGHYSEWLGPFDSGETVSASHTWSEEATYFVKVKAKDIYDLETDWSEKLTIRIQKGRNTHNQFSLRFMDNIFDLLTNLMPILRLLVQLS